MNIISVSFSRSAGQPVLCYKDVCKHDKGYSQGPKTALKIQETQIRKKKTIIWTLQKTDQMIYKSTWM